MSCYTSYMEKNDSRNNVIGAYVNNPTEENYMRIIDFIIETNPLYESFPENPKFRNTDNIDRLFNGN